MNQVEERVKAADIMKRSCLYTNHIAYCMKPFYVCSPRGVILFDHLGYYFCQQSITIQLHPAHHRHVRARQDAFGARDLECIEFPCVVRLVLYFRSAFTFISYLCLLCFCVDIFLVCIFAIICPSLQVNFVSLLYSCCTNNSTPSSTHRQSKKINRQSVFVYWLVNWVWYLFHRVELFCLSKVWSHVC